MEDEGLPMSDKFKVAEKMNSDLKRSQSVDMAHDVRKEWILLLLEEN